MKIFDSFGRLIYFFCNFGNSSSWSEAKLHDGKVLLVVFILTLAIALFYSWFFYKKYTLNNVKKRATQGKFYKLFLFSLITCFIVTEIVFAVTSKNPNSNILMPIFGIKCEILAFSVINLIYFTIIYACVTYFAKKKSINAKGIWFF